MVGLGAIPATIQMSCLGVMPETPRWLVKAEKSEQALVVLKKMYGVGELAENLAVFTVKNIQREIQEEDEVLAVGQYTTAFVRFKARFSQLVSIEGNYRALVIACLLQGSQQLCGFVSCKSSRFQKSDIDVLMQNSLMYYSATIFALLGFESPTLAALSVAVTNFLFTLVAFATIDRLGRRRILLSSIPLMFFGLSLAAVSFSKIDVSKTEKEASYGLWPYIILFAMVLYVAGYAVGLGCVPWQRSE